MHDPFIGLLMHRFPPKMSWQCTPRSLGVALFGRRDVIHSELGTGATALLTSEILKYNLITINRL